MKKELPYIAIALIGALALTFFSAHNAQEDPSVIIAVFDLYLVIAPLYFFGIAFLLLLLLIYFIRAIRLQFRNRSVNIIFLTVLTAVILVSSVVIYLLTNMPDITPAAK